MFCMKIIDVFRLKYNISIAIHLSIDVQRQRTAENLRRSDRESLMVDRPFGG